MKLLVFSDLGSDTNVLDDLGKLALRQNPDMLVFTGNVLGSGHLIREWEKALKEGRRARKSLPELETELQGIPEIFHKFFESLFKLQIPALVIPGEFDAPLELFYQIQQEYQPVVQYIHQSRISWNEFSFIGYGGKIVESTTFTEENYFAVAFPYSMLKYKFRKYKYSVSKNILVLHTHPFSMLDVEGNTIHTGCKLLNEAIEDLCPQVVICSANHATQGIDFISGSWIISPGKLHEGNYAFFDMETSDFLPGKI